MFIFSTELKKMYQYDRKVVTRKLARFFAEECINDCIPDETIKEKEPDKYSILIAQNVEVKGCYHIKQLHLNVIQELKENLSWVPYLDDLVDKYDKLTKSDYCAENSDIEFFYKFKEIKLTSKISNEIFGNLLLGNKTI